MIKFKVNHIGKELIYSYLKLKLNLRIEIKVIQRDKLIFLHLNKSLKIQMVEKVMVIMYIIADKLKFRIYS